MSKTERKNGSKVERALVDMTNDEDEWAMLYWFSPAMIAGRAGVSKPTAIKYLKMLEVAGIVVKARLGKFTFYRLERWEN